MNDYLTDEEQVERIKKWWQENGSSVIVGLVIGIGGLSGWRFWVEYKTAQAGEASTHFTQALGALEAGRKDDAIEQASLVLNEYSSTPYSDLSRLALAKAYVESGDFNRAASQLESLIHETREKSLEMIARKRLAAVQLQQDNLDAALSTLDIQYPESFTAVFEEMKGDVLVAKGDPQAARDAYQKARLANPGAANPRLLQQKLDDLGLASSAS
jgi:predicted negative regulator of RcsB-dependent stress response